MAQCALWTVTNQQPRLSRTVGLLVHHAMATDLLAPFVHGNRWGMHDALHRQHVYGWPCVSNPKSARQVMRACRSIQPVFVMIVRAVQAVSSRATGSSAPVPRHACSPGWRPQTSALGAARSKRNDLRCNGLRRCSGKSAEALMETEGLLDDLCFASDCYCNQIHSTSQSTPQHLAAGAEEVRQHLLAVVAECRPKIHHHLHATHATELASSARGFNTVNVISTWPVTRRCVDAGAAELMQRHDAVLWGATQRTVLSRWLFRMVRSSRSVRAPSTLSVMIVDGSGFGAGCMVRRRQSGCSHARLCLSGQECLLHEAACPRAHWGRAPLVGHCSQAESAPRAAAG